MFMYIHYSYYHEYWKSPTGMDALMAVPGLSDSEVIGSHLKLESEQPYVLPLCELISKATFKKMIYQTHA